MAAAMVGLMSVGVGVGVARFVTDVVVVVGVGFTMGLRWWLVSYDLF